MGSWAEENREDCVFISHGDALEDAEYVRDLIKERFGFRNFLISHIGPTIGAHSGPGTIALFFMGDHRAVSSMDFPASRILTALWTNRPSPMDALRLSR